NRARAHAPIPRKGVLARTAGGPGRDDPDRSSGTVYAGGDLSDACGRGVAKKEEGSGHKKRCGRRSNQRSSPQQTPVPEERHGAPETHLAVGFPPRAVLLQRQTSGGQPLCCQQQPLHGYRAGYTSSLRGFGCAGGGVEEAGKGGGELMRDRGFKWSRAPDARLRPHEAPPNVGGAASSRRAGSASSNAATARSRGRAGSTAPRG